MDRAQLKLAGKENFKKNAGGSIVACLPYTIMNFIISIIGTVFAAIWTKELFQIIFDNIKIYANNPEYWQGITRSFQLKSRLLSSNLQLVSSLVVIFLSVLINKFFLMNRKQSNCKVSDAFSSFKGSEYLKTVGGLILRDVYVFLWSLLFIIPGIIKFFSYFMVSYILAENPNIGANRAITISKETMKGAKVELFVFYLSFIGWKLLSSLTFGILDIFYVVPYYEAAKAEFYCNMKQKAKKMNICNAGELA